MAHRLIAACLLIVGFAILVHGAQDEQRGRSLPPWTPGVLDVHQISTGAGNSSLVIFPDGTSLLVDAGDESRFAENVRRPNNARRAGEWIARYVRQALRHDANPSLDYALITHLHGDHMGAITADSPTGSHGYKLSGLSEVAEHVLIRRVLDRAWPDYDYPSPISDIEEYRKFLYWQQENQNLRIERFSAGRSDQVRLLRDATRYPSFEVRNIAVNGEIWTGTAQQPFDSFLPCKRSAPRIIHQKTVAARQSESRIVGSRSLREATSLACQRQAVRRGWTWKRRSHRWWVVWTLRC
jgi:Metallo-beta-lactamase superfamily